MNTTPNPGPGGIDAPAPITTPVLRLGGITSAVLMLEDHTGRAGIEAPEHLDWSDFAAVCEWAEAEGMTLSGETRNLLWCALYHHSPADRQRLAVPDHHLAPLLRDTLGQRVPIEEI
ncbi:MAG: hypothetical protein OXI79_07350 [Gammaproteobacteria bacterium]|nr:hypothetical protein [Gammaproteobacteria bacterium]